MEPVEEHERQSGVAHEQPNELAKVGQATIVRLDALRLEGVDDPQSQVADQQESHHLPTGLLVPEITVG